MPPPPQHGSWKLLLLQALAPWERLFWSKPSLAQNDLRSIRNFLLLQYDTPLGSAVHATPLYAAIKHQLPDARIFVAASSMAASVLNCSPYVDRCLVTPDPWQDFPGAVRAVRQLYRSFPSGPVCIATTRGNQRSKAAFLAILAGHAVRTGFTLATPLYDLALTSHTDISQIEDNVDILRTLGHKVSAPEPRVYFGQEDADYASSLLKATLASGVQARIVYVTQNSGAQPNQWRPERFQQVIQALSASQNATPIFVGGAREAESIDVLRAPLVEKGISLAGKTTVSQLAAVLAQCDAAVSLDTGAFHVARAVQLPAVVIAPAWQDPVEWLPLGHPRYRVLRGNSIPEPPGGKFIDEIPVSQVIAATKDLLAHYPPFAASRRTRLTEALCDNSHTGCI